MRGEERGYALDMFSIVHYLNDFEFKYFTNSSSLVNIFFL